MSMAAPALTHDMKALHARLSAIQSSRHALNTELGYRHDWKMFTRWCEESERVSLPASTETVSLYLTALLEQGRKVSTAVRRTSGITHMHRASGYPTPVTDATWSLLAGARRLLRQPTRQMQPLSVEQLRAISGILAGDATVESLRDRAILVLGFTSALRRAAITQLLLSDIEFRPEGVVIQVRSGKDDQEGKGRSIGVPAGEHPDTCLASCLRAWITHRGTADGPLFTTVREKRLRHMAPSAVGRIVKRAVPRIGLDATLYAGHSLRSGCITAAGEAGVSHLVIAGHTGHRRMDTLRKYFRPTDVFRSNACAALGL